MEDFPEIPGYKIQRLLGQGRLTNVYLGIKEDIDEKVVIKVLQAELMSEQKFGKRFLYEAVKAAKLEHPNIAKILDMGETGNHFYFAIEYFKESLKESITQKHTDPDANVDNDDDVLQVHSTADIDVDAVLSVFKQLAEALDYAHKAGAVHQDIRPGNIFFKEDDTPVLVDFFMAPLVPKSSTLKIKGAHLCIPQYASPEQALRRPPEPTSDIYSLGIVLYEMLTGTVPYNAEETIAIENQHVMEPIPKLEEEVSIFQPLLEKMMCKKLEERAQSGFEVVQFIDILKNSPEELRQEAPKKEGEDFKLELDFTGTPGTKSSWQDNMPPLPEQSQTDFISESPREQTEFELDDHNAGGFQVEYGASDAVNDIPVPAPPEKDYLQPDLLQTPPKTDDSEESLDDLIVPGGGAEDEDYETQPDYQDDEAPRKLTRGNADGGIKKFLSPKILGIAAAVIVVIAAALFFLLSGDENSKTTPDSADTQAAADKPVLSPKKVEKRYSYKFASAKKLHKGGNFEKALKVLKQAEKYKSTDELIALKKDVTIKLTIKRDNTAFKKASKANTIAAFEEYANTYPAGLHIEEAQKITAQLKEVERLKEIERKKLLASRIKLRSKYTTLSKDQVKTMLRKNNFYDKYYNSTGQFIHLLKLQTINENKVVLDKTTGLIWHQAGSPEYMKFDLAQKWVEALNEQQYAGYSNWRMPTLEEAASLMENKENYHGLFLSTLFSNELKYSFSGDKSDDNKIWAIDFFGGDVSCVPLKYESFILPVCSMK